MSSASSASPISHRGIQWEVVHNVVEPQIRADGVHVWPFNPSFPVDVRHFVFDQHREIRLTRHGYFELLYVHSGKARYQVQDRSFSAQRNDLIVINGANYHRLSEVVDAPFKATVLYFLPDALGPAKGENSLYLMPFLAQDEKFQNIVSHRESLPAEIRSLIGKIEKVLPPNSDHARLAARTYLEMALVLLVNRYRSHLTVSSHYDRMQGIIERLQPLFDYLEVHYPESIALSKATSIVDMSKAHFMRSFKKVTGQSFDAYLNQFRIAKAQALLASTDKSISQISHEVGFCDQSYFGLVFRRLVRLTPREYRKGLPQP